MKIHRFLLATSYLLIKKKEKEKKKSFLMRKWSLKISLVSLFSIRKYLFYFLTFTNKKKCLQIASLCCRYHTYMWALKSFTVCWSCWCPSTSSLTVAQKHRVTWMLKAKKALDNLYSRQFAWRWVNTFKHFSQYTLRGNTLTCQYLPHKGLSFYSHSSRFCLVELCFLTGTLQKFIL